MSQNPDLARLAREGRERIEREAREQAKRDAQLGDINMRVALGAHYGSPRKRVCLGIVALGVLWGIVGGAAGWLEGARGALPLLLITNGFLGVALLQPVASVDQIARERAFVAGRPFRVSGYFEALSDAPMPEARLLVRVRFASSVPAPNLLNDVLGCIDTQATVDQAAGGLLIQSGAISGLTGIKSGGSWVYRNHRIVPWLHGLLEDVLGPVHASYPIASVDIDRVV